MAVVTGPNRDRAVARPPWVRRHDNQHEGVVAGIMLTLVIVGIAVFLFWVPLLRVVATSPWFPAASATPDRPTEGATPPGPAVVVTLDQPVLPSQAAVVEGALAASGAPANRSGAQAAHPDQIAEPAPAGLVGPNSIVAEATEPGEGARAEAEAAAANDVAETERAAEAARAAAVAAATPAPTATPAATATPRAPAPTALPTTVAAATGRRARVVRTGGRGVVMYSAPRQGARMPAGILEGTVVSVLGTSGAEWTQVQAAGGRAGWVKSEFLAPAN